MENVLFISYPKKQSMISEFLRGYCTIVSDSIETVISWLKAFSGDYDAIIFDTAFFGDYKEEDIVPTVEEQNKLLKIVEEERIPNCFHPLENISDFISLKTRLSLMLS